MFAKGGDYRAVCGPEREYLFRYLMVSMFCRKHADISTGINQVAFARGVVSDEKRATVILYLPVAISGKNRFFST